MQSQEASLKYLQTELMYQNEFPNKEENASIVFEYTEILYYVKTNACGLGTLFNIF